MLEQFAWEDAGKLCVGDDAILFHNRAQLHTFEDWTYTSSADTKVGNHCVLCPGSIFIDAAEIGDGCVVGASSIVMKGEKLLNDSESASPHVSTESESKGEWRVKKLQKFQGAPVGRVSE